MPDEPSTSGSGLDPKLSALLAYLLGIVGGIVFYAISKDPFVRFHAMQSILLWVAVVVLEFAFFILNFVAWFFSYFTWIIAVGLFAVWIIVMLKAYSGEKYKLPIIGDMAEKFAK
ncbi:MAG: hypothetical protein HW405_315 [Candidatus Berkelbacteria bacterium]|nr:hypothetical protein [Candidatus Berkelbacteria bacterium]